MKKRILSHFISMIIGGLIFGSAAFATTDYICVEFLPLKYFFNGIQKYPPLDQQGFIYNGRTYVPIRFVAESLGLSVDWDESDYSIRVNSLSSSNQSNNNQLEGYLTDLIQPFNTCGIVDINKKVTIGNDNYYKTIHAWHTSNFDLSASFNLNGKYNRLTLLVGTKQQAYTGGNPFTIYGDGNILWEGTLKQNELPQKVDINITGVKNLTFVGTSDWFILNPMVLVDPNLK